MSEYYSTVIIKVKDLEDWKKLYDLDINLFEHLTYVEDGLTVKDLIDENSPILKLDGGADEREIEDIVYEVSKVLDKKCLIFADTNNCNIDPYSYIVYYIGKDVEIDGADSCEDENYDSNSEDTSAWGYCDATSTIPNKLNFLKKYYNVKFNKKTLEYLDEFGLYTKQIRDGYKFYERGDLIY